MEAGTKVALPDARIITLTEPVEIMLIAKSFYDHETGITHAVMSIAVKAPKELLVLRKELKK
jgi:hypothetical protein